MSLKCSKCSAVEFDVEAWSNEPQHLTLSCRVCRWPVSVKGSKAQVVINYQEGLCPVLNIEGVRATLVKLRNEYLNDIEKGDKLASSALAQVNSLFQMEEEITIDTLRNEYVKVSKVPISPLIRDASDWAYMTARKDKRLDVLKRLADTLSTINEDGE